MNSDPFKFTTGPRDARIVIVGEGWGDQEASFGKPFVGSSGQELDRMLNEAGFDREQILCANVLNDRPPDGKMEKLFAKKKSGTPEKWGLYPLSPIVEGLKQLEVILNAHPRTIIIAAGNFAFWALTGKNSTASADADLGGGLVPTGIASWRGSMLHCRAEFACVPCLPIIHPVMVFKEYSWRSILIHDFSARIPKAFTPHDWMVPPRTKLAQPSVDEIISFLTDELKKLDGGEILYRVCDIETKRRNIVCTGIAISKVWAICIPHCGVDAGGKLTSWFPFEDEVRIIRLLRRWLLHPNIRLIGQNFLYDMQYLSRWLRAARIKCFYDTMLAQHVMFPGTPKSLDYLASLYNEHYVFWKNESQEWDERDGGIQTLFNYNCMDCLNNYETWEQQSVALDQVGMRPHFEFLMNSNELCFDMMVDGFLIDQEARRQMLYDNIIPEVTSRQKWLAKIIPQTYMKGLIKENKKSKKWWESTHQQRILFYDVLGLRRQTKRKTSKITIDDEALNKLKVLYPALTRIFEVMAECRSLGVFKNTFLEAPLDPDGRMRCSFNPGGTETFRYSSSTNAFWRGTNLQNIPKGDED